MYDITIGRSAEDKKKFGHKGTILLGKHYVKMGQTVNLSNEVYLDVSTSHVVFICGKRGGGKSYTMGVIAEGLADVDPEIAQNLSIIMLDTMGVYWTMKYPNKKDEILLNQWGKKPKGLDVKIFTPVGYYQQYKDKGVPTDYPFSIKPSELNVDDWCLSLDVNKHEPEGVLIETTIYNLREKSENYSLDEIIKEVMASEDSQQDTKLAVKNMFKNAKTWGLFDEHGTPLKDLAIGGQVTVLDVSCYATLAGGWAIKSLVVGLISQRLFIERMISRKDEEFQSIHGTMHYFTDDSYEKDKQQLPLVWLVIDEAHEFLPREGKTAASDALITILREGRQPGISLILASQQPGKIHTDVMTQSDTVLSHRITAKIDVDALGMLMQSYMREGLVQIIDNLPREKGAAIIFDDTNERMFPIRVRPRFTWHGGAAPSAMREKKKTFKF